MRRFLMFLVVALVSVSIGMTVYYFVYDDEVISYNTTSLYLNAGTHLSLDDLEYKHIKPTQKTQIDYNAGGTSVTELIEFDQSLNRYIVKAGGKTTIVIKTTHEKYAQFLIDVTIGDGTSENPFYISTESELSQIGDNKFGLNKHYELLNSIMITKPFTSIGYDKTIANTLGEDLGFGGYFEGNNYSIEGLKIYSGTDNLQQAGLFTQILKEGTVTNLLIKNATIAGDADNSYGSFENAGIIAGSSYGLIDKCQIENGVIKNNYYSDSLSVNTGLAVGLLKSQNGTNIAKIYRVSATGTIDAYSNAGGIAGSAVEAIIRACWTNAQINFVAGNASFENNVGGLIGKQKSTENMGQTLECYSLSQIEIDGSATNLNAGMLIGNLENNRTGYSVLGLYFNNSLSVMSGVGNATNAIGTYGATGKTPTELKTPAEYKFYQKTSGGDEDWSKNVWVLRDGEYPQIMFLNRPMPALPTNPNLEGEITPVEEDDVDDVSDLRQIFLNNMSGRIKIMQDIDLGGQEWTPIEGFEGELCAEENGNGGYFAIKNFKISAAGTDVGFFKDISKAYIHDIQFEQIIITANAVNVGFVAGYANGIGSNAVVNNVRVIDSSLNSNAKNIGGLFGQSRGYTIGSSGVYACTISSSLAAESNITSAYYMGGLVAQLVSGEISDCEIVSVAITGYGSVGGLAGYNLAQIKNCRVLLYNDDVFEPVTSVSTLAASSASKINSFTGGAVGYNEGFLDDVLVECSITSQNLNASSTLYVGGVAGYNNGEIAFGRINAGNGVVAQATVGMVYLGGVAGFNSLKANILNKCYSTVILNLDDEGEIAATVGYQGGIVGNNEGTINTCYATGNIGGYMVGGIAGKNSGDISECYASGDRLTFEDDNSTATAYNPTEMTRNKLIGWSVAGLVCEMREGTVINCFVACQLFSTVADNLIPVDFRKKAGFVIEFGGSQQSHGIIQNCISACTFDGSYTGNSLECPQYFMGEKWLTGVITNCVLDKTAGSNAKVQTMGIFGWDLFGAIKVVNGSNFGALTTTECTTEFTNYKGFNMSFWNLQTGYYPILKAFI